MTKISARKETSMIRHVRGIQRNISDHTKKDDKALTSLRGSHQELKIGLKTLRVDQHLLQVEVAAIKEDVKINTELTKQIHEILAGVKFIAVAAKWIAAILAAFTGGWQAWSFWKSLK